MCTKWQHIVYHRWYGMGSDWAHCMEQRHVWEANSTLVLHEIPCVLPQHIYHSLSLVIVVSQMSPIHAWSSILILLSCTCLGLVSTLGFPTNTMYVCMSLVPFCVIHCLHLILIGCSTLIAFSEDSKSWRSPLDVTYLFVMLVLAN